MLSFNPMPCQFGGKLKSPNFYLACNVVIATLRPYASLRTVANHLNKAGFPTPSGLTWNRDRLANYIRSSAANSITQ